VQRCVLLEWPVPRKTLLGEHLRAQRAGSKPWVQASPLVYLPSKLVQTNIKTMISSEGIKA